MPTWNDIALDRAEISNEGVVALWIPMLHAVPEGLLRIKASGSWAAVGGTLPECTPEGLASLAVDDARKIVADCPVGALLGKFGGSSASQKKVDATAALAEEQPFVIGSHCVVQAPKTNGPFFVGFNLAYRPIKVIHLKLEIAQPG